MELSFGGKVYEPISAGSYTMAYDLYVQTLLVNAGIADLIAAHAEVTEKDEEAFGRLVLDKLAASGKAADLVAAFVQPKDGTWSVEWAIKTAREFDALPSQDERRTLLAILVEGIGSFFRGARRLSTTSR